MSQEDTKNLTRLKAERTQLRRLFTISARKVEESIHSGEKDDLFVKFAELADKAERLFKVEESAKDLIYSLVTDDNELENEIKSSEKYREQWITLVAERDLIMAVKPELDADQKSFSAVSDATGATIRMKKRFKFPKLELRKFDGDIRNWVKFWAFFKKIDVDDEIEEDEKFEYLIQCMQEGSKARAIVESFPPTATNYRAALEHLKQRFGRDELLIEIYIRELLGLVLNRLSGQPLELRSLYDQLETRLRALQGLGVASDKYAYMLLPLVESALPEEIFNSWERSRPDSDDGLKEASKKLDDLLKFLCKEVERAERRGMTQELFSRMDLNDSSKTEEDKKKQAAENVHRTPTPTAADLVNVESRNKKRACIFCEKPSHESGACFTAMSQTVSEIEKTLMKKGCCMACMKPNHRKMECRASVKCVICHGRHLPLLCRERKVAGSSESSTKSDKGAASVEQSLSNISSLPNVLMQTLLVVLRGRMEVRARLLIDTGSQRSYITKRMISKLGYDPIRHEQLIHALFGGQKSAPTMHECFRIRLQSASGEYSCNFEALETEVICQAVPIAARGPWLHELQRKGITLSDVEDGPIDILVGADIAGKLWTEHMEVLPSGLVALQTLLGWTLMGKVDGALFLKTCDTYLTMICAEMTPSDLWKLEILGIADPVEKLSKELKLLQTKEHFNSTVEILDTGRYQVQLPWREDHPPLQRNFELAKMRLEKSQKQLRNAGMEKAYANVLIEWLQEGIIEEVKQEEWDFGHYLPHRAVYKVGSTIPVRPVFDASAREKGHPSLNQCLETGPTLIEQIPAILLRFRYGKIGMISDVKKAFLQISLTPSDRDSLRFIWKEEDGQLRIFRHSRVVFGVCSSPFLLGSVFEHHLNSCLQKIEKGELDTPPSVIDRLRNCLYVDNYVGSLSNEAEVEPFINHARSVFAMACFDLRGWERTNPDLDQHLDAQVLGLNWDPKSDELRIKIPDFHDVNSNCITKKVLLSIFQRLFDPIGLTSPVTVLPKRLFQKACAEGEGWDKEMDENSRNDIVKWMSQIPALSEIRVPRWFENCDAEGATVTLHTFCDASLVAYAAVVFVRIEYQDRVSLQFVTSKSRIAPLEKITIPRLELLAATVGARLTHNVLQVLNNVSATYYWTDSSTALTWVQKEEPWAVFVGNRVNEIRRLSDKRDWRHIAGLLNPADLASRGCSPLALIKQKWWEGPSWLYLPEAEWPHSPFEVSLDDVMAERKKTVVVAVSQPVPVMNSVILTSRFSQFHRIVNVVGWMLRFLFNKFSTNQKFRGPLSVKELDWAEKLILKVIQEEAFSGKGDPLLKKLKPEIDRNGLLRLRTKIWARKESKDFRAPIILPSQHVLVTKLILHVHYRNGHIVSQGLLALLREKYWVLRGRQSARRALKSCVRCQRVAARAMDVETPPLPEDRVRDALIFEVCGTDLAGPLYLRSGEKVWICIFTCAVYRAVYLDLVSSLSTDAFMLAFRRFVSRHGRPKIMYSDNGTNFHGLHNALNDIDWEKIQGVCAVDRIEWRFNPPTAAWWGGFWERLIGMVKVVLRKILGRASLSMEELTTVVYESAAFVNSRPITFVSEDPNDPVPITPQMFISDVRETGLPDFDEIESNNFEKRVRRRVETMANLRERFRTEYLGQLNQASDKWRNTHIPKIGELVMIESSKKRFEWPLAIVEEIYPGADGHCRVVKVKTADGLLTRQIQRVFPLEVPLGEATTNDEDESNCLNSSSEDSEEEGEESPPVGALTQATRPDCETVGQEKNFEEESAPGVEEGTHVEKATQKTSGTWDATTRCGRRVKLPTRFM